jgi:DeoR family transcriptional regulator of aga operon
MNSVDGKHKNTVQRRKEILEILNVEGEVFVEHLSKKFVVSEVTIRKDLDTLEKSKLLLRARGGAIKLKSGVGVDYRISEKHRLNYKEKTLIGQYAAALVSNGETILVDGGTTTLEMVNHLPLDIELTVITNALNIANVLSGHAKVNVIVPGGSLRKNSLSLVGPLAEKAIKDFYVDKTFLGVDGIDPGKGIYTPNIEEAYLNQMMISLADQTIILSDSSKFNRKSLNLICTPKDIDVLITDENIHPENIKGLEDAGVKVIVAK